MLRLPPAHPLARLARRPPARGYAVSVNAPLEYPGKALPRVYSERKTFLYHAYTRLFQASAAAPLIFLQHKDFSATRLVKLRADLADALARHERTRTPSLASPGAAAAPSHPYAPDAPVLRVLRTSIFGVALRDHAPLDAATAHAIASVVTGGLAVLALPALDPPALHALLRALERSVPPPTQTAAQQAQERADKAAAQAAAATPGRRAKRVRPTMTPELHVVGALIDGRVFGPAGVQDVARLPGMDTLRAQIVGLLSAPATQLAGVLSQASGGTLARTLDGFRASLEDPAQVAAPDAETP